MDCSKYNDIHGLQFMPVLSNKKPIFNDWQSTKTKYDLSKCEAVGLVCGKISGNIESLDFDMKYSLNPNMFKEYCAIVKQLDPTLLPLLLVQQTVSGGFHFVYRCSFIEGNLKLANRHTTEEEKKATYEKAYASEYAKLIDAQYEISNAEKAAKVVAENSAKNDKVRVLIETRGEKGYIATYPTKGYLIKQGSFDKIQTITAAQRSILFNVAFGFNEVLKEVVHREVKQKKQTKGLTPIEDYNERADVVQLLEQHGWEAVGRKGAKILMKRPGDTKADHSGNYDEERHWFSVFSTSTQFEAQTPYQPYAVYTVLELDGDYQKTPKVLYDLGYGDRIESIRENTTEVSSIIDTSVDDISFLATPADYDDYLDKWRKGTFPMGATTGIPELDKYFRFKDGNLVIINGIDNVGKSTVIWYLSMLSTMYNDWPWLIFSSENSVGSVVRKLIEFYWSEPIANMNNLKYKQAKDWVERKFDFIKTGKQLYNYKDLLNMTEIALKRKKYKGVMIDPYNSLKLDIPAKSKQQGYEYHYEAASVMQLFGKTNDISIYLNCHVGTTGARKKDDKGFTLAPQKEDSEMGVMFANKADDFLTVHRVTQHETEWMMTEIHVRKIKETETGGKVTPIHKPFKMKMVNGLTGFEYFGYNPVLEWHKKRNGVETQPINFTEPINEQEPEEREATF